MTESKPVAPFKAQGELNHLGWDIPTQYILDANGQCWKDSAHGGGVSQCTPEQLVATAADMGEGTQNVLRGILGLPYPEPDWMRIARANGWVPPTKV